MTVYTVLTVDDSRKQLKGAIHEAMNDTGFRVMQARCVDGRIPGKIDYALQANGLKVTGGPFHNGELGIWLSVVNVMYDFLINTSGESLLVFEDDAVVHQPIFNQIYPKVMEELPDDWDFFAWAIPSDQKVDYYYNRIFNENGGWYIFNHIRHTYTGSPHYIGKNLVCKTYQGYQAVAIQYSRKGIIKFLNMIKERGLETPIDLFLFTESFKGTLNGYTLLPDVFPVVTFEEQGTIARNSGMYN